MNLPVFHFQNSGAYLVLVWCCAFRPKTVASPFPRAGSPAFSGRFGNPYKILQVTPSLYRAADYLLERRSNNNSQQEQEQAAV